MPSLALWIRNGNVTNLVKVCQVCSIPMQLARMNFPAIHFYENGVKSSFIILRQYYIGQYYHVLVRTPEANRQQIRRHIAIALV